MSPLGIPAIIGRTVLFTGMTLRVERGAAVSMRLSTGNRTTQRNPTPLSGAFYTWDLGSNLGHRDRKQATNSLKNGHFHVEYVILSLLIRKFPCSDLDYHINFLAEIFHEFPFLLRTNVRIVS
jgi:hypothetical protein